MRSSLVLALYATPSVFSCNCTHMQRFEILSCTCTCILRDDDDDDADDDDDDDDDVDDDAADDDDDVGVISENILESQARIFWSHKRDIDHDAR